MSIRRITPAPPAPQPGDTSDVFNGKAFPFAAWLAALGGEFNGSLDDLEELVATLTSSGFTATSNTVMTIEAGAKALVASSGAAFVGGQSVVISSTANPANSMTGTVTAYDSGTGNMTVTITSPNGAGTFADWTIGLALTADLSAFLEKTGGTITGLLTLAAGVGFLLTPGAAPVGRGDGWSWREAAKLMHRIGAVDFEIALVERAQTFLSKTLTGPIINGGTISGGTASGMAITGYTETQVAAVTGAALSPNLANGTIFPLITNANATITLPAPAVGKSFIVPVQFGGAHTITWAGGARKWVDGTVPSPTSVNGKTDVFAFVSDYAGANWLGFPSGQNL